MFKEAPITLNDLKEVGMLSVEMDKQRILLAYHNRQVWAIDDKCPHLGASLANGVFSKGIVTCYKHHAQIDVTSGEILEKAKLLFIKMPTKKAKTYTTRVKDNKISIDL